MLNRRRLLNIVGSKELMPVINLVCTKLFSIESSPTVIFKIILKVDGLQDSVTTFYLLKSSFPLVVSRKVLWGWVCPREGEPLAPGDPFDRLTLLKRRMSRNLVNRSDYIEKWNDRGRYGKGNEQLSNYFFLTLISHNHLIDQGIATVETTISVSSNVH